MRNTDYTNDALGTLFSNDSLQALRALVDELGLEIEEVTSL